MIRKISIFLGLAIIMLIWLSVISTNLHAVKPGTCFVCIRISDEEKSCQLNEPDSGWTKCGQYNRNECHVYGIDCSLY